MIKGGLKRMLNPQTVALIGVTEKEDTPGRTLLENLCSWSKDSRKIFMVNPNRKTVLGHECYPEISAVPEHIDLSIIVTPAPTVPEIVEECGKVDTEGIIIISAGFREIGEEGRRLEGSDQDDQGSIWNENHWPQLSGCHQTPCRFECFHLKGLAERREHCLHLPERGIGRCCF